MRASGRALFRSYYASAPTFSAMASVAPNTRLVKMDARRTQAPRVLRRLLAAVAVTAGCIALAFGGLWLGLRLSTPATYGSALGTDSFQVQPAAHGAVEVFIIPPTTRAGQSSSSC